MRENSESAVQRKWFTVGVAISLSAATFASPIGTSMDQPWRFDAKGVEVPMNYTRGPDTAFQVPRQPWSGAWWATKTGSIALRWHTALIPDGSTYQWPSLSQSNTLHYTPFTADQLANMSETQLLEELSPIEKVDVVAGRTNPKNGYYKNLAEVRGFVSNIVNRHSDELGYHGLCHGFSHASMWLPEPDYTKIPAELTLSDGSKKTIQLPFGSGDLKAIATYYYGMRTFDASEYQTGFIGANDDGGAAMNPAALHLLLLNLTNDGRQSFVVDLSPGKQVWNYPVVGYDMTTTGQSSFVDSNSGAVKAYYLSTRVDYQRTTTPYDYAFGAFPNAVFKGQQFKQQFYKYRLEVTADDRIVGGEWLSGSDRPDFAWVLKGRIPFTGDYSFLEKYWPSR